MPVIKFKNLTGGMAPDISPHKMQADKTSYLYNYRNWKGACSKIGGQQIELPTMPLDQPNLIDFWRQQFSQDNSYWITAKAGQVWKTDPLGNSAEITRNNTDYVDVFTGAALTDETIWISSKLYGGLTFILNSGHTAPQYVTSNSQISPGGLLQDIPGWIWNAPGDTNPYVARTAQTVRSFDNQLWAGNITNKRQDGTLEYLPNVILYSDKSTNPANTKSGYIPDVWQPSSGTSNLASNWAGYVSLDTSDPIVDMIPLRDSLLVFTTNEIYIINKLQQPQQAISPQRFSEVRGLLSNDCAVSFDGKVFFVSNDDIIITTGSSLDFPSLANQLIKDSFFDEYLTKNIQWQQNVFVRFNKFYNEVWVFFPSVASETGACDRALIWDVESGGWSMVDTPLLYGAAYAPTIGDSDIIGLRPWTGINYAFNRMHFQDGTNLLVQDVGYTRAFGVTQAYTTIFEKVYDLEEQGGDPTNVKNIDGIYPFIYGNTVAKFKMKFSNIPYRGPISWISSDYTGDFTTSEDYKMDPMRVGRYVAVQITTFDQQGHEITSIDFDVELKGKRG
jgi:hypothetical protein